MSDPAADRIDLTPDLIDGRFARFDAITWWDQSKLTAAKVLVIGAGALGNELIKNLALLGVGNLLIVDLDTIERSNLSRSVLYGEADLGRPKAVVAAEGARRIYPEINAVGIDADVLHGLGTAVFRWADVVFGGLDNREARLHVNRQCWRFGRPWVDGAIEQIQGVARLFAPDVEQQRPCYECTLGERDFQLLAQRRTCNMLTREQRAGGGHTPTTPTIASIIAAIQVQEWLKYLHGLPTTPGEAFTFVGQTGDGFRVAYQRRDDCLAHETLGDVAALDVGTRDVTLGELLAEATSRLGDGATLDLGRDVVVSFDCPTCGTSEPVFAPLGTLRVDRSICPCDGATRRSPTLVDSIDAASPFLGMSCAAFGVPAFDVITARLGDRAIGLELAGDAADVLATLADGGLTWLS